jgi:transcription elongation factor Elf1
MSYFINKKYNNTLTIICSKCNIIGYDISIDEYFINIDYYNNWKCRDCAINENRKKNKVKYYKVIKKKSKFYT